MLSVGEDLQGIGYSGIGACSSSVKPLRIAKKAEDQFFGVEPEVVYANKYPLARYLYVYVNKHPSKPLDPLVHEFLKFALSAEGQEVVIKDGYLPLRASMVAEELKKLGSTDAARPKGDPAEATQKKG